MTSLATQLKSIASLDASRLTSKFGVPSSKSYLFPPKIASSHDLDAIFSLAQSGYDELLDLDPGMEEFEDELFSESSRRVDRMLLNKEDNRELDVVLEKCLRRLGRWIGIMAGGKCLEWLVRRFRVHEMNADTVLQVFLPYHESPNFPRMLAILTFPTTSPYHGPFAPLIKKAQPLPRSYITTSLSPAKDPSLHLLNDVAGMVKQALDEGVVHRALLTFWSSTMVELLEKSRTGKGVSEAVVKILVEAFINILSTKAGGVDVNAAVYPPLVLLARTTILADEPFNALLSSMLTPDSGANPSQRILTLLVLLNDRPTWNEGLGDAAPRHLSQIKKLGEILIAAIKKYGFEQATAIILSVLLDQPELNKQTLTTLCDYSKLPSSLVKLASSRLMAVGSKRSTSDLTKVICKTLLGTLRERHPLLVDETYQSIAASLPKDHDLIIKTGVETAFVDIYSADVSSRVNGIREIFELLRTDKSSHSADVPAAKAALQARLKDTDAEVIKAIYANPTDLHKSVNGRDYLEAIAPIFTGSNPDHEIIQLHLSYIRSPFLSTDMIDQRDVFTKILYPCLLASQARQAFGVAEWNMLSGGSFQDLEVFGSLVPEIKSTWVLNANGAEPADDKLIAWNATLGRVLATSIAGSSNVDFYLAFLLDQLSSDLPSSRILAHLILANIVLSDESDRQITLAVKVLELMEEKFAGSNSINVLEAEEPFAKSYLKAIYRKTNSSSTGLRATLSLMASMTKVARPSAQIAWLVEDNQVSPVPYKSFANILYKISNTSTLPPALARTLLQSLLTQLGEESLIFLASVWLSTSSTGLRTSALRHAKAFITAYASSKSATDFQLIVPALLIALQDGAKSVREAAVDVIKTLTSGIGGVTANIYALDAIYGPRSNLVQLLKQSDLQRYLQVLLDSSDDIVIDAGRLTVLHTAILGPTQPGKDAKKSDMSHRRAVIGCLMSHVQALGSYRRRRILLDITSGAQPSARLQGILHLLLPLIDASSEESMWLKPKTTAEQSEYLRTLFSSVGVQSVKVLESESEAWRCFMDLLTVPSTSGFGLRLRSMSIERMIDGVFAHLKPPQQIAYLLGLLSSLHTLPTDEVFALRKALAKLIVIPELLVEVISHLIQPLEISGHRKKQKADDSDEINKMDQAVADLTVLIDSRDWKVIPGNANLVASLMSVLSALLAKRQQISEGTDYLEQEILGAILALVEKIHDNAEITGAHVGFEVIIKVIRASTNPRTSQRALLVASELARLIPDAVLHNIMPIFTFMGSSDFQRDDAYSFGVVEKTVSRIVPVMTRSLKDKATSKIELYNESRTFISIFTDMAGRLPKHRTLPFFVHLVKSLDPIDFLAPITMLLVDRGNTKAGRSLGVSPLDLPLSLAAAFDLTTREVVLLEVVNEILRLVVDLSKEEKEAFLNQSASENDKADTALRRITLLLHFATGLAKQISDKPCTQATIEEIVRLLIVLSAITSQPTMKGSEVSPALETTLSTVMQLLSVEGFLAVTLKLLNQGTGQDINTYTSLGIFVHRLPLVRPDLRTKFASSITEIIKRISGLLSPSSTSTAIALSALRAVVSTAQASEDAALAQTVPKLVDISSKLSDSSQTVATLSLIETICRHLNSRIIPYVQSIVETTLAIIKSSKVPSSVVQQSFATVASVVESVPTFINSKQLSAILRAGIDHRSKDETLSTSFIGTIAKKIPTKTLFPVVMDLWKSIQTGETAILEAFFDLLRLTLRNADRKTLPTLVKPIFAFFLEVFDLRHRLQQESFDSQAIDRIEESAIGSFLELVTKLNEATFKPLFIRLYDWAVVDLADGKAIGDARLIERKIVLLHVMMGLLQKFRHLLSPYIGTMLAHIEEVLDAYADGEINDLPLWILLLQVLGKSFEVDDGAYWTEALHLQLIPHLISQLPLFPSASSYLAATLSQLASSTTSEPVLKKLNSEICLITRSENPQTRMSALKALEALWSSQAVAEEMLQFVPETVSEFLAELLEDENSDVEGMARKVLARIEGLTGSLKEYLE